MLPLKVYHTRFWYIASWCRSFILCCYMWSADFCRVLKEIESSMLLFRWKVAGYLSWSIWRVYSILSWILFTNLGCQPSNLTALQLIRVSNLPSNRVVSPVTILNSQGYSKVFRMKPLKYWHIGYNLLFDIKLSNVLVVLVPIFLLHGGKSIRSVSFNTTQLRRRFLYFKNPHDRFDYRLIRVWNVLPPKKEKILVHLR